MNYQQQSQFPSAQQSREWDRSYNQAHNLNYQNSSHAQEPSYLRPVSPNFDQYQRIKEKYLSQNSTQQGSFQYKPQGGKEKELAEQNEEAGYQEPPEKQQNIKEIANNFLSKPLIKRYSEQEQVPTTQQSHKNFFNEYSPQKAGTNYEQNQTGQDKDDSDSEFSEFSPNEELKQFFQNDYLQNEQN